MKSAICKIPVTVSALAAVFMTAAAQEMPKTTKETIRGAVKAIKQKMSGTVLQAEGNALAVRMSTGEIKEFVVPADRKFIIDGEKLTVNQLKPGTELHAVISTHTTPVTQRTTTIGTGTVWYVSGNNVIVTLPNGENRNYTVNDDYRFMVDGQKASVHDLRRGMKISAEKIVEEPASEISRDVAVTGHAPTGTKPKTE